MFLLFKKPFCWLVAFILLCVGNMWGYEPTMLPPLFSQQEEAVTIAKQDLPFQGTLEQGPDGFVYLKVTNDYINRLFPLIKEGGFNVPSSIKRQTKVGAHISIFYKDEARSIGPIKELGKVYSFDPDSIKHVRAGRKIYIILTVKAPQLEELRQSYGLLPQLRGHEFHITLAEKNLHHLNRH